MSNHPSRPGWHQDKVQPLLEHPRVPLVEDSVTLPDGTTSRYARLLLGDAVTVVIVQRDKVLLNLEYAYPVDDRLHRPDNITSDGWLYKFPGGMLQKDESFDAAAIREVAEETGIQITGITLLAAVRNYFPRSNSIDYKVAAALEGHSKPQRDREEANMEQRWLTPAQIDHLISDRDPRVLHSHFLDTWHLYKSLGQ
jgi:8-oxo-dGTP pyrophosphatase MutT (NUDIX family)